MKKEIKIREAARSEQIKDAINKMETIQNELKIESNIAAIRPEKKKYGKSAQIQEVYSSKSMQFSEKENQNKTRNCANNELFQ